ncbi:MAG: hypothetical protein HOO96_31885 [Polyangiaceae bacterium]|nr:hypothetical protein [Polyangiaceae bacterium]
MGGLLSSTLVVASYLLPVGAAVSSVRYDRLLGDLRLDDETIYMGAGVRLGTPGYPNQESGWPSPEWSPLYAVHYWILHLFERQRTDLYFLNHALLVSLVAVLLVRLLQVMGVSPRAMVLVSVLFATSEVVRVWPFPTMLLTAVFLGGVLVARRRRHPATALATLACSAALAMYVRPEYILATGLLGAAATWYGARDLVRGTLGKRAALLSMAAWMLPLAALVHLLGLPLGGGRFSYAFHQHYALAVAEARALPVDVWAEWWAIFHTDFGPAETFGDAYRANPEAVYAHFGRTLVALPVHLGHWAFPYMRERWHMAMGLLLAFAVITETLRRLVSGFSPARRKDRAAVLAGWASLACIVSGGVPAIGLYPRDHYLLPIVIVGASVVVARTARWSIRRSTRRRMAWAAISVFAAWALYSTPPHIRPELVGVVDAVEEARPAPSTVVLERGWSYAFLAGYDGERVLEWTKDGGYDQWARKKHISMVIDTPPLRQHPLLRGDGEFQSFLANPEAAGFRVYTRPGAKWRVLYRAPR